MLERDNPPGHVAPAQVILQLEEQCMHDAFVWQRERQLAAGLAWPALLQPVQQQSAVAEDVDVRVGSGPSRHDLTGHTTWSRT